MASKKKSVIPREATFVSHVKTNGEVNNTNTKAGEKSCFYITLHDHKEASIEADLLPGEILISQVAKVTQYVAYSNENTGHIGTLFVTNYKVSFVTLLTDRSPNHDKYSGRRNKLIGKDDVALTSISDIYNVTKGRKKKLMRGSLSREPISCLELHCKDFRIHSFSFENCDRAEVNKMVNTIIHHSFHSRSDLLFAFSFDVERLSPRLGEFCDVPDFTFAEDWVSEMVRLKVSQSFRVTNCNAQYALSTELPEYFVVPSTLKDSDIIDFKAESSRRCLPLWCYSYANGCALVRLAYGNNSEVTGKMIQAVKDSHPKTRKPGVIDLGDGRLPLLRDLQSSYERLREQCMPATNKDLWNSDLTWYSALENCQWLRVVSIALQVAYEIVEKLSFENRSVVIREKDGATDFSPVVSSLTQLMMDPPSRTIPGFQSLIEKEWVALGHRFTYRCGIVYQSDAEESPLFLLFLDCVWQLLQQFPSEFEFSEIYLTSLWDSIGLAMFRNFIFNGPYSRSVLGAPSRSGRSPLPKTPNGCSKLMTVWDWEKQFYAEDVALFTNPLYVAHEQIAKWQWRDLEFDKAYRKFTQRMTGADSKSGSLSPKQTIDARKLWRLQSTDVLALVGKEVLRPGFKAPQIKLWEHCYLRWLTPIQIVGGGMPSEFLAQSVLMEEIRALQDKIGSLETSVAKPSVGRNSKRLKVKVPFAVKLNDCISSSYPFSPTRPPNLSIVPAVSPSLQRSSLNEDSNSEDFVFLDRSEC